MLPYNAVTMIDTTLREFYTPEETARISPLTAMWTESGDAASILTRAVEQTKRLASRIAAFAL